MEDKARGMNGMDSPGYQPGRKGFRNRREAVLWAVTLILFGLTVLFIGCAPGPGPSMPPARSLNKAPDLIGLAFAEKVRLGYKRDVEIDLVPAAGSRSFYYGTDSARRSEGNLRTSGAGTTPVLRLDSGRSTSPG